MKRDAILFILTWVVILSVQAIAQQQAEGAAPLAPVSAFLPPLGQTVHYRFSDTIVTPKESRSEAGTLTLTAVGGNEIKATLAIGEKAPRSFAFQVDPTGALQPAAELDPPSDKPHRSGKSEPSAREQAFLLRLSLAARIGAHPGEEMSMPVLLNVPWASGPVNPILYVKPTTPDAFVGEATDTTTTNPPQQGRAHIFRRIAISAGAGVIAGQIGGTTGRVVRPIVTVGSILIATRGRSGGPLPTDVSLHITGQLGDGRLQRLSGNQEYSVPAQKHARAFSDQWQFVAQ